MRIKKEKIALLMILLVLSLPIVIAQELSATLPPVSRARSIDIPGTAPQESSVELRINNELRRKILDVGQGNFTFYNVLLKQDKNNIKLQSKDSVGRIQTKEYTVIVDDKPPELELELPQLITKTPVEIKGKTNEPIIITYTVTKGADQTPPDAVLNLEAKTVSSNEVNLQWSSPIAEDILEYSIYRNNKRVAVTKELTYKDSSVGSNTSYEYTISAVDKSCNEGPKKLLLVTTQKGTSKEKPVQETKLSCYVTPQTLEVKQAGEFTISLNLIPDVPNIVSLVAKDLAGHEVKKIQVMSIDTQPPVFDVKSLNLKDLSPSYTPKVHVRGKVSEKSAITVFVNNRAVSTKLTDDAGNFDMPITLERKIETVKKEKTAALESDVQWVNNIKLVAVDGAGHRTEYGPVPVLYALCGSGGNFRINFGSPIPTKLTPRLMMQGLQTFGFPFNMTYAGKYPVRLRNIAVHPLRLSPKERENYDQDWIATPFVFKEVSKDGKNVNGYVQVQFKSFDPLSEVEGATTYAKEKKLSEHRTGDCLIPGFGCAKFYLEMETQYSEKQPVLVFDETKNQYIEQEQYTQPITQKTCDRVEVAIDMVRPEKLLPDKHLESVIKFLSATIDAIDGILKPLTNINTFLVYSCLTGTLGLSFLNFKEGWVCKFKSGLDKLPGLGKDGVWNSEIAEAGLCEQVYEDKAKDSCKICQKAIENRKKFEFNILRPACDRVAGPPAPTLQNWLKQKAGEATEITKFIPEGKISEVELKHDNKVFVGSDCAYLEDPKTRNAVFGETGAGYERVKKIYENWKNPKLKEQCSALTRPANPDCCGFEYMSEWGTACGISQLGLDPFNEIKESVCLGANIAGQNQITLADGSTEQCYRLWNSVAGFCEPQGGPTAQPIQTGVKYTEKPASAETDEVYVFVYPVGESTEKGYETAKYKVFLGYVSKKFKFEELKKEKNQPPGKENYYLSPDLYARETKEITNIVYDEKGTLIEQTNQKKLSELRKEICQEATQTDDCSGGEKSEAILAQIRAVVGSTDQTYIVVPDSGLLRSMQCLYTPGIIGWLSRWKQIATHAKTCFQTIQATGDGSPGICQEFLSTYVCDFVFDALSCFAQKYSITPTGAERKYGGIGDVLGAITHAGARTQERMRGRYGETALWKSLFVEKKLQHAICQFAFTGTWALDVEAIAKLSVEQVPIPSQAVLAPCRRRFVGYTPIKAFGGVTGLTSWMYEMNVFVAPGSDLDLELQLQCSDGFRCDSRDGYKGGECDCNKGGKKITTVFPDNFQSFLPKEEVYDQPVQMLVQATNADPNPTVRYDKAVLKWRSRDPNIPAHLREGQTECSFNLVGGDAPSFCSFDPFTLSYRCQFGAQESGIKLFESPESKPEYTNAFVNKATNVSIPVFTKSEVLNFILKIKQLFPSDNKGMLNQRKFLTYKIVNQRGVTIHDLLSDEGIISMNKNMLATDGTSNKKVEIKLPFDDLKEEHFGRSEQRILFTGYDVSADKVLPQDFQDFISIDLFDQAGNLIKGTKYFVLEFEEKEGQLFMNVYESAGVDVPVTNRPVTERGFQVLPETASSPMKALKNVPVKFNEEIRLQRPSEDRSKTQYNLVIKIKKNPLLPQRSKTQVFVSHPKKERKAEAVLCSNEARPVTWQAVFTIHDADEFGNPTDQISVDPQTGEEASVSIPFDIICAKEEASLNLGEIKTLEVIEKEENKEGTSSTSPAPSKDKTFV